MGKENLFDFRIRTESWKESRWGQAHSFLCFGLQTGKRRRYTTGAEEYNTGTPKARHISLRGVTPIARAMSHQRMGEARNCVCLLVVDEGEKAN